MLQTAWGFVPRAVIQGLLSLTPARSTSHSTWFKAAMFGLVPSVHDGGKWLQKKMVSASLPDTRVEDGDALVADAV